MPFGNEMSADDTHSNDYAAGTASDKTFAERRAVEQSRATIGAYRFSKLGSNFAARGEYVRPKARTEKKPKHHFTRQEMNAQARAVPERAESGPQKPATTTRIATFREPSGRRHNPYA